MQYLTLVCTQPGQALYGFPFDVPLPNAAITVYAAGTATLATLFDKTGGALSNPFSAGIDGIGKFAAANGVYDIQVQSADAAYSAPRIESQQMFDFSDIAGISNLSALGSTGLVVRTGSSGGVSTYAARAIAGTSGKITVANGDGVAGNPTVAIPAGAITNTELAPGAAAANLGYTAENAANKSTATTLGASNTLYPTQNAVKTYVDGQVAGAKTLAVGGDLTGALPNPALGALRGVALSADVLQQGQAYAYDAMSNTYKGRSIEGLNFLINPSFDIWQENTTYIPTNTAAKTFIADGWKCAATNVGRTVSQVAGIANSKYAVKIQRTASNALTGLVRIAQQLGQADSMFLAGKTVVVSFDFTVGANYSQIQGPFVNVYYGTSVDEDIDLHVASPNFVTGGATVGGGTLTPQVAAFGNVARINSNPIAIPAGVTEIAVEVRTAAYVGTAGADDSCTIGNIKLEIGNIATHFRKPYGGDELERCLRRYRKTFLQATVPAQNVGAGNGEFVAAATKAGATVQTLGTMEFGVPMRVAPTVTLFNPAAANAQVRDLTAGVDCSASTAQNITESACEILTTGTASTAVGGRLGVHLVMDARL